MARHKCEGSQREDEDEIRKILGKYAGYGTVYLRDGGDRFGACELAAKVADDFGIEYSSPAFPIYPKGSYGSFIGRPFDSLVEFEELVEEAAHKNADFVKVMLSGIMDFNRYGTITGSPVDAETIRKLVSISHRRGLSVMAHVNGADTILAAVKAGVDSIEHGYFSDERSREALASSTTIWVPTLSPVCNLIGSGHAGGGSFDDGVLKRISESQMAAIREVAEMGGTIAMGSDAGAGEVFHVDAQRTERELMGKALGEAADRILMRGLDEIRERFRPWR